MTLVRGVIRGARSSALKAKSRSSERRSGTGTAPAKRTPGLVDRKAGRRVDDFVASVRVGLQRVPDRRFGPGGDDDPAWRDVHAACAGDVFGDRIAEGEDSGGVAVAGAAGVEGLHRDPVQVGCAAEVGRAQVEADHFHPPVDASLDVVAELEGVLGAQAAHAVGDQGQGDSPSSTGGTCRGWRRRRRKLWENARAAQWPIGPGPRGACGRRATPVGRAVQWLIGPGPPIMGEDRTPFCRQERVT